MFKGELRYTKRKRYFKNNAFIIWLETENRQNMLRKKIAFKKRTMYVGNNL